MRRFLNSPNLRAGIIAVFSGAAILSACSGGNQGTPVAPIVTHGSGVPTTAPSSSPTPHGSPTPTPSPSSSPSSVCPVGFSRVTAPIGPAGGAITVPATVGSVTETFASGAFSAATTVTLCYITEPNLPAPLTRIVHVDRYGNRLPLFKAGAGNTYVTSFGTLFGGATLRNSAAVSGTGVVPASIPAGTVLNIAINENGTWVDVGTALVGAGGTFQSTIPTLALPDVTRPGNYLVYKPPSGGTTQVNLGFALIADDSTGNPNGLQFVQIEDPHGVAIPTPTTTYFPISNASDLDGEALTPDAQHGATVDGGNNVYFFSGIPQHKFVLSPTTVDVTNYGGDGDSIAALPNGDEDVVSANGTQLAVLSGILAGTPAVADTIDNPGGTSDRDGLVISIDGKVLLSRGSSGLDVIRIDPSAPHKGSTGVGTVSHTFTITKTLTNGPTPFFEDGRDGMAISPTDSSRAVIVGADASFNPVVSLLTGLPNNPTLSAVYVRTTGAAHPAGTARRGFEPSYSRRPISQALPAGESLTAAAITPDGKIAFVNSNAGIYTFSGVDTGTLTQVGSAYAPTVNIPGGTCSFSTSSFGSASIGILPDGKYLILDINCGLSPNGTTQHGPGVVLTVPIGPNGALGNPVGQLDYAVAPYNDQIIVH